MGYVRVTIHYIDFSTGSRRHGRDCAERRRSDVSLLYVVWPSACVNRQYEEPTTFADVDTGDYTLDDTGGGTVRTHEIP